jgi:hypothetical protein
LVVEVDVEAGITRKPYSADKLVLTDTIVESDRHRVRLQMSQYTVFACPVVDQNVVSKHSLRGVVRELRIDQPAVLDSVVGHVVGDCHDPPGGWRIDRGVIRDPILRLARVAPMP